jgi:hypothetical protein
LTTTIAPSLASALAICAPMPLEAPEIIATLLFNFINTPCYEAE